MNNEAQDLRENAERCRRLAAVVEDKKTKRILEEMATQLEEQAAVLEASNPPG